MRNLRLVKRRQVLVKSRRRSRKGRDVVAAFRVSRSKLSEIYLSLVFRSVVARSATHNAAKFFGEMALISETKFIRDVRE